jgi:Flp pilus assembly pilin Flp
MKQRIKLMVQRCAADQAGSTPLEYAIVAVALALTILIMVWTLGDEIEEMFQMAPEQQKTTQME